MRALVTGAFGFAGRYLVEHLLQHGDKVMGTWLHEESLDLKCEKAHLDIRNISDCQRVISKFRPEVVYHLAGIAFPPDAERDFSEALAVNVEGTYNVFRSCHDLGMPVKIVLVSSAEIYGKVKKLPIVEEMPVSPYNNYSLTKAMAEAVAERFSASAMLKSVQIRAFNHMGPGQRLDFVISNFAFQLASIAKGKADPVLCVGNLDAKRDFTNVRDVIRGYRLAALKGSGVYNLCSGKSVSIGDVLKTLIEISGLKVEIKTDPARLRPSDTLDVYGSFQKAKAELGWSPEFTDLRQSLKEVYDYWLKAD